MWRLLTNTALPEKIVAQSLQSKQYNVWDLQNLPIVLNDKEFKLSELATIEKYQTPQQIAKENQQYKFCVQYEYMRAYERAQGVGECRQGVSETNCQWIYHSE
jgi:multidrug efflux pump subunit AcrB